MNRTNVLKALGVGLVIAMASPWLMDGMGISPIGLGLGVIGFAVTLTLLNRKQRQA